MSSPFGPSVLHAIGDGSGGRVQLRTCTLEPYAYVSCEHPEELLEAIKCALGPNSWLGCDDGRIVQVRHVVQARVADPSDAGIVYPGDVVGG